MAFDLENETISYGDYDVLHSISLHIQKGEKIALLGKSGSGKSTLLKYMYEHKASHCTYIPQELGLVSNLSVFHNVYMAKLDEYSTFTNIRNLLFPSFEQKNKVEKLLSSLQLDNQLMSKTKELSGGQKQRCAIARALYTNNNVLLSDEPISALDEYLSDKVLDILNTSFETHICALHNVPLAIAHFDRVIGLKNGKVLVDKHCSQLNDDDRQKLYYACE